MNEATAISLNGSAVAVDAPGNSGNAQRKPVILAAAVLGNLVGINILMLYSVGIFLGTLQQEFGWSRTETSLSVTWFTIVVFLGTPVIGRVADRVDPGRLAALSLVAVGVALLLFPHWIDSVRSLWFFYFGVAVLGLGTSPAVVNKTVVATFSRTRGLAVGVALAGAGIGTFVAPRLTAALIERGGWKLGYTGLGLLAIGIAPFIWFGLGGRSTDAPGGSPERGSNTSGMPFNAAYRTRVFWLLSIISVLAGFGLTGAMTNLVPFLRDHGLRSSEAARFASLLGLSSIAGRVITGYTLDRVNGPFPGLPFIGIGALGVLMLVEFDIRLATLSILMLGFVLGSEFDLLSYFTSRYFGLRAQATVFGWNYGMVAVGAAIAPVVIGALRDQRGNYVMGFLISSICLGAAAGLCPFLGRYRYAV
jgi:MFS family permease